MSSFRSLRRQVEVLKRQAQQAGGPPGPNLARVLIEVLHGVPVPPEQLAALAEAWQDAQRAAEERPTVEEMIEAALQATPQRLPCGFRELRPDERLASGGGEQRRAD